MVQAVFFLFLIFNGAILVHLRVIIGNFFNTIGIGFRHFRLRKRGGLCFYNVVGIGIFFVLWCR